MRGWLASVDLDADERAPVERAADRALHLARRPSADQVERARAKADRTGVPVEAAMVALQQTDDQSVMIRASLRYIAQRTSSLIDAMAAFVAVAGPLVASPPAGDERASPDDQG